MEINTEFDFSRGVWTSDYEKYLARHDLVFLSPPSDAVQHGMPIGNGRLGAVAWCENDKLKIILQCCDLWHDSRNPYSGWHSETENPDPTDFPRLLNGCELTVDFHMPVFDASTLYGFEARLAIFNGDITVKAESPYGEADALIYVDYDRDCLNCRVKASFKTAASVTVTMERFTSPPNHLWCFYEIKNRESVKRDASQTKTVKINGVPFLRGESSDGHFYCGFITNGNGRYHANNGNGFYKRFRSKKHDIKICATVTEPGVGDIYGFLNDCAKNCVRAENDARRREFWSRSFMETDNGYRDNLWYLAMHYADSSQRGKYPGRFINGIWSHRKSLQPWLYYFHQNQQTIYWPLLAAGHAELLNSYLGYRFSTLAAGKKGTAELFGSDGLFVSDVEDRNGTPSFAHKHNHTPAAEIALLFYDFYEYTMDADFLRDRAYPYMKEALIFLYGRTEKRDDGLFHFKPGTAYEGWLLYEDTLTEIFAFKALLNKFLKALLILKPRDTDYAFWKNVAENLAEPYIVAAAAHVIEKEGGAYYYKKGAHKGERADTNKVFAIGKDADTGGVESGTDASGTENNRARFYELRSLTGDATKYESTDDVKIKDGIFPAAPFSPVFPSSYVNLFTAESEPEYFAAAVNTVKAYAPPTMGWHPLAICACRLGLGVTAERILNCFIREWQFYNNGLGHYGGLIDAYKENTLPFNVNEIENLLTGEKIFSRSWDCRHWGLENLFVAATAMNEKVLQSVGDEICVAPAVTDNFSSKFTLHARNGVRVSGEIRNGKTEWFYIASTAKTTCKIRNPWDRCFYNGTYREDKIITVDMSENGAVLFTPEECRQIILLRQKNIINRAAKHNPSGVTVLGSDKCF
jgi:hypothetical protein